MNVVRKSFVLSILPMLLFFSESIRAADIISFHPTGSVKQVQQVTVRFSEEMMPMGDPRPKEEPFLVSCKMASSHNDSGDDEEQKNTTPKFSTRWADSKNWTLEFEKPLPSGIRCQFKLNSKTKALSGQRIKGVEKYVFSTGGPAILGTAPRNEDIEPNQYFVLLLDGPINFTSVQNKAYFEVQGLPDKVNVRVIDGEEREETIKGAVGSNWRWNDYEQLLKQNPARKITQMKEFDNFIVLAATRRFPENSKVILHWPKGILSASSMPVEESQRFKFDVIEAFKANFVCTRNSAKSLCNPLLDMHIEFTRRIPLNSLRGAKLVSKKGKEWVPLELADSVDSRSFIENLISDLKSFVGSKNTSGPEDKQVSRITFKAPFPASTEFKVQLPKQVSDELGRTLSNQNKFPLAVATEEYSPLLKFPATFGILELKADPILPVSVRNIEKNISTQQLSFEGTSLNISNGQNLDKVISWYNKVRRKDQRDDWRNKSLLAKGQGQKFTVAKPRGEKDFELIGIPLKKTGFYIVEMESPRLGKALTDTDQPMYVDTAALVTDMAVHFKKGRESSLVWVTSLSSGKPVNGADIAIFNGAGQELKKGKTNSDGVFHLENWNHTCKYGDYNENDEENRNPCELFVFGKKNEDFSFTASSWEKGIENYRFNIYTDDGDRQWGPSLTHTVLDRMVAQPGDSVRMKHVLRMHQPSGFSLMPQKFLPKRVVIVHQGSFKNYTLPFDYQKSSGSGLNEFKIPKDAPLGQYLIYLSNADEKKLEQNEESGFDWTAKNSGSFIVTQYRLPLMKASIKVLEAPLVSPGKVKMDLSAGYLSGGPAKKDRKSVV